MYYQCIHQKLYHLTQAEYDDFTSIILHARKVSENSKPINVLKSKSVFICSILKLLCTGVHVDSWRKQRVPEPLVVSEANEVV